MKSNLSRSIIFTGIVLVFQVFISKAQSGTIASGNDASGSGGTVAYSIGQVSCINISGASGKVDQGIQQPFEIFTLDIEDELPWNFSVDIFPNPTSDNLMMEVKKFSPEKLSYLLSDAQGKLLKRKMISSAKTQIFMHNLPSATYFIHFLHDDIIIESFRIIKN